MSRRTLVLAVVLSSCGDAAVEEPAEDFADPFVVECLATTFFSDIEAREAGCDTCPTPWFGGEGPPDPDLGGRIGLRFPPDGELVVRAVEEVESGVALVLEDRFGEEHTITIGRVRVADLALFEVGTTVFAETTSPDFHRTRTLRGASGELLLADQTRSKSAGLRDAWDAGDFVLEAEAPPCVAYRPGQSYAPLRKRMRVGRGTFVLEPEGTAIVERGRDRFAVRGFWLSEGRTISRNGLAVSASLWVLRLPDP
ncbi:MAG: hypothetical protein AAGH15_08955 [Myxococcota bacterium]